jgi:predicted ATPase
MPTLPSGPSQPRFGDLLRHLRVARGLTQELLAERTGLSVRGISDLERGARALPQRETILRLVEGLDLSGDEQTLLLWLAQRAPRPRLVSLDAGWPFASGRLAARPEAFVGRAAELSAILRALHDPASRLLTLTGPPGVGKTRLAIEATQRFAALATDDIVFVDLAPLTSPLLVLPAVASAVGVRETAAGALHDRLRAHLAVRPALLVLDNFEHLLAAAPVAGDLLQVSAAVRVLVTSREPLRVDGEQVLPVPPLATPLLAGEMPRQDVISHEAVELFVTRAREIDRAFQLSDENARSIAELCVRLDGLPLAIELAAARITHLSPAAMVERLAQRRPVLTASRRDLPERQRTLADAIDWSYALLGEDAQRLFRRLSVFRGGFTVEAAESVMGDRVITRVAPGDGGIGDDPAFSLSPHHPMTPSPDTLTSLVDKSLLVRQPGRGDGVRLMMLETIREYGLERLAVSGEEGEVREAHAAYFLAFAEEAARAFRGGAAQRAAIERLEDEHDNLRQALAWALEQKDPATALRLTDALWRFWWNQGHLSEGHRWLERMLEQSRDAAPAMKARTLIAAGRLAWLCGRLPLAWERLEQALALEPEPFDRCEALNALSDVARHQGAYERADAALSEALEVGRAHEDWFHLGASLHNLGTVALDQGDYGRAQVALEEGLVYARRVEHHYLIQSALDFLGRLAVEQGDYARAAALRREGLAVQRELAPTSPIGAAACLEGVAVLAIVQNQPAPAARLFGLAATLRDRAEAIEQAERSRIAAAREHLGEEGFRREWAVGRDLPLEVAFAEADELLERWSWTETGDPACGAARSFPARLFP